MGLEAIDVHSVVVVVVLLLFSLKNKFSACCCLDDSGDDEDEDEECDDDDELRDDESGECADEVMSKSWLMGRPIGATIDDETFEAAVPGALLSKLVKSSLIWIVDVGAFVVTDGVS